MGARDGADPDEYEIKGVKKMIEDRCVMCHNEGSSTLPDFSDFEQLHELTEEDSGATFGSLTRVSHIHLFGISFIFMFVGIIFNFSQSTSIFIKCVAVGMPYVFLIADILSWWLTKFHPMFAWIVIVAGMGMAISFIFMWATAILEIWMYHFVYIGTNRKEQIKQGRDTVLAMYSIVKHDFLRVKKILLSIIQSLIKFFSGLKN